MSPLLQWTYKGVVSFEGQFRSIWWWPLMRGNLEVFGVVSLEGQFRSIWWWPLMTGTLEVFGGGL